MTISNTARTAGPYAGTGANTIFPFAFKVFARSDLLVATTVAATGVETVLALDAGYTVTLNQSQNTSPGGVITLTDPLPVGVSLAATSSLPIQQSLELTNQGGFYPTVINDALDRIVITIQQLAARIGFGALNVGAAATIAAVLAALNGPDNVSILRFMSDAQKADAKARTKLLDMSGAIETGIAYLVSIGGGELWFPSGTYKTTRNINVPSSVSLRGANRYSSIIDGIDMTHAGFTPTGNAVEISSLFIRGMSIGVASTTGRFCRVFNNFISYNRIGVDWNEGYINSIYQNNITHNSYGMVLRGQSYAMHVYDNVIDNNTGGLGVLLLGSPGCVIRDNTIEGNEKTSKHGVGVVVIGISVRLSIEGNWFEQNGSPYLSDNVTPNPYAVDILLGDGTSTVGAAIANNCIPDEYKSQVVGAVALPGTVTIRDNQFYQSKYSIMARLDSAAFNYIVEGNQFNGVGGLGQRPVQINYISGGASSQYPGLIVRNNQCLINFGGTTAEMLQGPGGGYVYSNVETPFNLVKVDGVDLYTMRMTCAQFAALPGATFNVQWRLPTSGVASSANSYRSQMSSSGLSTTESTGRLRLGSAAVLTVGQQFYGVVVAKPGGQFVFVYSGGAAGIPCNVNGVANLLNIYGPNTPTDAEVTLATGEYYGYCFMTAANAATYFKGSTRLELTDLDIVNDQTRATAPPSSTLQNCFAGDVVYNSNPTTGGIFAWVCTVSGTPGTWKPIAIGA